MRGNLCGYVVRDDRPIPDASITIVHGPGSHADIAPVSDADGWFALDDLTPGQWRLRANAPDGSKGEASVDVWENSLSEVTIPLASASKSTASKRGKKSGGADGAGREGRRGRGTVVGRVTDSVTGEPVANAPVVVTDGPGPLPDLSYLTDDNGQFVIPEMEPGDWVLTVDADGLGRGMLMVGVLSDRSVSVSLALIPDPTDDYWEKPTAP